MVECVVAAAMGVAGSGVEVPEFTECGAPADAGAEGGDHVGQAATVCLRSGHRDRRREGLRTGLPGRVQGCILPVGAVRKCGQASGVPAVARSPT